LFCHNVQEALVDPQVTALVIQLASEAPSPENNYGWLVGIRPAGSPNAKFGMLQRAVVTVLIFS
jgi:hypothetical protein